LLTQGEIILKDKFEDTIGVIRNRSSKKDKQYIIIKRQKDKQYIIVKRQKMIYKTICKNKYACFTLKPNNHLNLVGKFLELSSTKYWKISR